MTVSKQKNCTYTKLNCLKNSECANISSCLFKILI